MDCTVIHRYGELQPERPDRAGGGRERHRGDAFAACEFIMDYLKTQAPFWKKEHHPDGRALGRTRASRTIRPPSAGARLKQQQRL